MSTVNPYELLGLQPNFTIEQLKSNYKRIALKVHPDKMGGSDYMFNLVTQCYKQLANEYKLKQQDKQFDELRESSRSYINEQKQNPYENTRMRYEYDPSSDMTKRFSLDRFNKAFEENRVETATDIGYKQWMDSQQVKDAPQLKKNISNDKFNSYFEKYAEKNVDPKQKMVVRYKEPEPMLLAKKINFTELGTDKIDDFSGENKSLKSLNFMDYRVAHTTSRIVDPKLVQRQEFKSIEDVERDRANIRQFTSKELTDLERKKKKEELREKKRQETQLKMDEMTAEQFMRLHKLMLGQQLSKY